MQSMTFRRFSAMNFRNPQLLLEALKTAGSGFNMRRDMALLDGNKRVAQVEFSCGRLLMEDAFDLFGCA